MPPFSDKVILTTGLEINKNEVVYICYAHLIKPWVEFIYNLTSLKYPANIHNVSLRTFIECILNLNKGMESLYILK